MRFSQQIPVDTNYRVTVDTVQLYKHADGEAWTLVETRNGKQRPHHARRGDDVSINEWTAIDTRSVTHPDGRGHYERFRVVTETDGQVTVHQPGHDGDPEWDAEFTDSGKLSETPVPGVLSYCREKTSEEGTYVTAARYRVFRRLLDAYDIVHLLTVSVDVQSDGSWSSHGEYRRVRPDD